MAICTITGALPIMRRLGYADARRLVGVGIDDAWRLHVKINSRWDAKGWPDQLIEQLAAAGAQVATPPVYVVLSDGLPVCWLGADGVVATSTATLTRTQQRHADQAAQALGDLYRHSLGRLADACAQGEGRHDDLDGGEPRPDRLGWLRVANPARPARAWWVPISGDLDQSRRQVAEATGTPEPLIITANWYGDYGRLAHRPGLDVLCAITRAAAAHELPTGVVGNWLATEGGVAGPINAADIPAAFSQVYIGQFSNELAYTAYRLEELGWEKALRQLGAWEFLDTRAVNRHLFAYEVHAIRDESAGIVVCRRGHTS